jgi:drug/metabolite transporter (DMT)-like permease
MMSEPGEHSIDGTPANGKPKTSLKPILITLLCTVLLGAGTCFGFLSTFNLNRNVPVANVFAVVFIISVLAFIAGVIWLLVAWARNAAGKD